MILQEDRRGGQGHGGNNEAESKEHHLEAGVLQRNAGTDDRE